MTTGIQTTQNDIELARIVRENAVFAKSRVDEESEHNRRTLWIAIYREVFTNSQRNQHTQAMDAADKAVTAYDAKFGA